MVGPLDLWTKIKKTHRLYQVTPHKSWIWRTLGHVTKKNSYCHFHNASKKYFWPKKFLNFMHGFKSAILAIFQFWSSHLRRVTWYNRWIFDFGPKVQWSSHLWRVIWKICEFFILVQRSNGPAFYEDSYDIIFETFILVQRSNGPAIYEESNEKSVNFWFWSEGPMVQPFMKSHII